MALTTKQISKLLRDAPDDLLAFKTEWQQLLPAIKSDPVKQIPLVLQIKPRWKSQLVVAIIADDSLETSDPASKQMLKVALDLGADPNQADMSGVTALHVAAKSDSQDLCSLLLQYGADPNVQDHQLQTPLHLAAGTVDGRCCAVLLLHGADVTAQTEHGRTPLAYATSHAVVELLLQHGSDPNASSIWPERTLLHMATFLSNRERCELLLQYGANPNAQNSGNGDTPLHLAAKKKDSLEVCELLVYCGADPMIKNNEGKIPLQVASGSNYDDPTLQFLISKLRDWDANLFRELCMQGQAKLLSRYLDNFRVISDPPRHTANTYVYYRDMYIFYGMPWLRVSDTPLHHVLNGADDVPGLVAHPVFERVLNTMWVFLPDDSRQSRWRVVLYSMRFQLWLLLSLRRIHKTNMQATCCRISPIAQSFGRSMYVSESLLFLILLVSTYYSFISNDTQGGRAVSMTTTCIFLLLEILDWSKRPLAYVRDVTNWINLFTYLGIVIVDVTPTVYLSTETTKLAQAILITLLAFCGLEYLRMLPLTSLLISITFKMVKDVIKFGVLYGVFQIGFSGAFFLLFQDDGSRYNTYGEAFLATFLMLFGDFDSDLFLRLEGVKAVVANGLVLLYLVGAMVMLMNLLIAMMSTSYQKIVDSAKIARSIGRAEIILRMESLLPQHIREYLFDVRFASPDCLEQIYASHKTNAKVSPAQAMVATAPDTHNPDLATTNNNLTEAHAAVNPGNTEMVGKKSGDASHRVTKKTLKELNAAADKRWREMIPKGMRGVVMVGDTEVQTLDDRNIVDIVEGSTSVEQELQRVQDELEQVHHEIQQVRKDLNSSLDAYKKQSEQQLQRLTQTQEERLQNQQQIVAKQLALQSENTMSKLIELQLLLMAKSSGCSGQDRTA